MSALERDETSTVAVARDGDGTTDGTGPVVDPATTSESTTTPEDVPDSSFDFSPNTPQVGVPVTFLSSSANALTSLHWDFGDGTSAQGARVEHTYESPGSFPVSLRATGPRGMSESVLTVVVDAAAAEGQGTVPAVVGLLADSALTRIHQAGLTGIVTFAELPDGSADIGRVLEQSPPPGTMMASFEVTLVVGR